MPEPLQCVSLDSPRRIQPGPHRAGWRGFPPGVLAGVSCLALFVLQAITLPNPVAADSLICPMLLMDFECKQYLRQLADAGSPAQRERVEQRYQHTLEERRRLCRSPELHDVSHLRRSLSQAGLRAELYKP